MTISQAKETPRAGLTVTPAFAAGTADPYAAVGWERRRAEIKDDKGAVVWSQDDCEVPETWSQLATDVVASKYFYGDPRKTRPDGGPEREHSVRQLVARVCDPLAARGEADGYFASPGDAEAFRRELIGLCLGQYAAFNSPVWFNMGLWHKYGIAGPANNWVWDRDAGAAVRCQNAYERPQGSACFIQSVRDDMEGIMTLAASEAMLFKYGSGTGSDLSTLRSSREHVSGGGRASGPVSFMQIYDATASVVKSGGKTRRAAKMQTLKVGHPDILEFIEAKPREEKKAQALIRAGYEANFNGEAYASVKFQNCNMSVRATDEFLRLAQGVEPAPGPADADWYTYEVCTGARSVGYNAARLLARVAEGTWLCGDPGVQYEDTIQRWHTCPNTAPINSSNPCSEYMFIDDSACNLASINLLKFRRADGTIDDQALRAAVRVFITAQEILVDMGSYPTAAIAENSHKFRPLGLGFCNLGALLMACGFPYDSDEGRALAGVLTALLHGQAYLTSAEHAAHLGPFAGFAANRGPMLRVVRMHQAAVEAIDARGNGELGRLKARAVLLWRDVVAAGEEHGFRNSQVTVIAPTGTIAFLMDADTTGVEPDVALVKYKNLAGRGQLKIINRTVALALQTLGYDAPTVRGILDHVERHDTIEDVHDDTVHFYSGLRPQDLPVFDCAFRPHNGTRAIAWEGHVRMMAAVQPFVSGAISKTVNMSRETTPAQIKEAYLLGWRLGLKALAVYRDGSKWSQPVGTSRGHGDAAAAAWRETEEGRAYLAVVGRLTDFLGSAPAPHAVEPALAGLIAAARRAAVPARRKLPGNREALTHRFEIHSSQGPVEGYVNVGFYPGTRNPGEIFITMSKQGSTVSGLMDVIATLVSLGLQYGVPLEVFVRKFAHTRFEPNGLTDNPDVPVARSVADYVFRWLGMEFIPGYREENAPQRPAPAPPADRVRGVRAAAVHPAVIDGDTSDFLDPGVTDRVLREFADGGARRNGTAPAAYNGTPKTKPNLPERAWQSATAAAQLTGPPCPRCHTIMVPSGPCHRCLACGNDAGGCG